MHQTQRQQTYALLKERGIDQAIFARPESVNWLTGFAPPVQMGPNLFAAGNPLVWYDSGHFTLIIIDTYAALAAPFAAEPDGQVITYIGRSMDRAVNSGAELLNAFNRVAKMTTVSRVGIEHNFVNALIAAAIPTPQLTAIDGWLEPLRMIKTPEELITLRRNFALTDIGHAAAREAVVPGISEIEVWNAAHSAIEKAAGCRVPLGNDCVVSTRSFNEGGWPADLKVRSGDSLIVDLSVILDGYWSDSCATYYATERNAEQNKMHSVIAAALDFAISLVRPGAVAREIDQKVKQFIEDAGYPAYTHHTGHSVGVSGHEAPRIVPYNTEVIQAGMVIMVEPGSYLPGLAAVRLEDALLVTADGSEILTHHDKN